MREQRQPDGLGQFPELQRMNVSYPLFAIKQQLNRGHIVPDPDYQRFTMTKYNQEFRTQLIESVITGIPIPALLFVRTKSGVMEVLDGQQRIRALVDYYDGDYKLNARYLEILPPSFACKFSQLPEIAQDRIENYNLNVDLIYDDSSVRKQDVFIRINKGVAKIKPMELRNSEYHESSTYLRLKEFSQSDEWLNFFQDPPKRNGADRRNERMQLTEKLLRFLMISERAPTLPPNGMAPMLDSYLESITELKNDYNVEDSIRRAKEWMSISEDIFGKFPFRLIRIDQEKWPDGKVSTKVFGSNLDVMSYCLTRAVKTYGRPALMACSHKIRTDYISFINNRDIGGEKHNNYYIFIENRSYTGTTINERIRLYWPILEKTLEEHRNSRDRDRCFPEHFLSQLWDSQKNRDCCFCGTLITCKERAVVDHRIPWVEGGDTSQLNGGLAHIYCNQREGGSIAMQQEMNTNLRRGGE